jgi:ligand-binding SRPBCC domain-containing protein
MRIFHLRDELLIARPREEVFAFFAEAGNLDAITPPWLNFRIVTPQPIAMRVGTKIDYKLRVHGFPASWRTLISAWEPPGRFVDEQLRGPYRLWVHEHTFEETAGGTLVRDHVRYAPIGGWLTHRLFVRRDVERIFAFRKEAMKEKFPTSRR